jgi:hypothetical protein
MGTTTNNGWTYPESTDLVKDGATAIETLATNIDTTLGVYADPGLVLINTTSFSGVASQSFNNVFSASYKKYKFIGNILQAGADSAFFRLRASGADAAGSNYVRTNYLLTASPAITAQTGTGTSFSISDDTASRNIFVDIDLYDPFGTVNTNILYKAGFSGQGVRDGNVLHNLTTSYDGFSIIAGVSTISGEISVYGYNE